jgi:hypothetical protein
MGLKILLNQFILVHSIRRFLVAAMLLLVTGAVNKTGAQTVVTIGPASSTSSTAGPTTSSLSGDRNERHTVIYSTTELLSAGLVNGSSIMSIAWEKTSSGFYYEPNLTIRVWLKHSATTTFAANPSFATETSSATLMYQTTTGSIPSETGWKTFDFNTGNNFVWNGTQNLQVITEIIRPSSWLSSTFSWRTTTTVTNAAANASGTSAAPPATLTRTGTRPQIRLGISTSGNDAGLIAMPSPTGGAPGLQNISVTIRNSGSTTLTSATINWSVNGGAPTSFPWSGSLAPGATATVVVGSNSFASGIHIVSATISDPNGLPDQDPANNTVTKTIVICSGPLSGAYTINKTLPTSGSNFNSFNDLSSVLTQCGVNGNVVVTVAAGTGPYTEQVTFNSIAGLGSSATLTIQGSNEILTAPAPILTANSERAVLRIKELSYITVNNLQVNMPAGSTAFIGVSIMNTGDHISITNCNFNMTPGTSTLMGAMVASAHPTSLLEEGAFTDLTFNGNTSTGGGYGVSCNGLTAGSATGIVVTNNTINGTNSNAVYLQNTNGVLVANNNINFAASNGIQLAQAGNINGVVRDNFVSCTNPTNTLTFRGIYFFGNTPGSPNKAINNVIRNMNAPNGDIIGIGVRTAGAELYFNTVILDLPAGTSDFTVGYDEELSNLNTLLRNNIFYITRAASDYTAAIAMTGTANPTSINSNFNVFYTANGANVAVQKSNPVTAYATLANWQSASGGDANSFQTDPQFQAGTAIPQSGVINGQGTPIAGITTDILGTVRSNPPDPGAYEFSPPSGDAAITDYVLPALPHCASTLDVIFELTNAGGDPLTSVTINWTVNGVPQTPVNWTGTLASGASTNVLLGNIPVAPATFYDFTATASSPNGGVDINPANDSFTYLDFSMGYQGVITINAGAPVSPTNSQTFQSLADRLSLYGVCAAVTINVMNGPYTEQVVFNAIPGTSSTARVTLNGNNQLLQFFPAIANFDHILQLNGVNYMNVENLRVTSLHPTQGRGIHITNDASKIVLNNNEVTVSTINDASTTFGIIISGENWLLDGSLSDSVIITGNKVTGGYSAIQLSGEHWTQPLTRMRVEGNIVLDWYGFGVYLSYTNNAIVRSNVIRRPTRVNSGSDAVTPAGITIPAGSLGFMLDKNRIYDLHLAMPGTPTISRGVYVSGTTTAPTSGTIQNNLIYGMTNDGAQYGIQQNSVNGPINIYHNTIVLNSANGASTSNTNAINMSRFEPQFGTAIRNNIFVVTRGGTGIKRIFDIDDAGSVFTSNNNIAWLNAPGGTQTFGQVGSTTYTTFTDWQTGTGKDLNSLFADPLFVSPPTGNFTPSLFLADGTMMGTTSVGVLDDILGVVRSANPDAGAFEWIPPPCSAATGGTATITGTSSFCTSGSTTLASTGYSGGTGTSYQWQSSSDNFVSNVVDLAGQTNPASATTGTITATTYYRLRVVCSNGPITGYSNIVTVTVGQAATITTQPVSQTRCTGTSVTFSVVANNAVSYQWQKNTVNIPGATAANYTINNLLMSDAGTYRVVITAQAPCTSVTSNDAVLTMQESVAITTQPVSQSVCSGSNVTFNVTATGTGITYQWRKAGVNIAGATASTYTITNVATGDAGVYDVIVTGSCGSLTSNPATLTVNIPGTWIGVTSTDWNTASNWCGGIPTTTTDVLINAGAPNMPNLSNGTGSARQITIGTGASLTVGNAGILNIYGDVVNNGTWTASAGSLAFRGTVSQSIPAFITLNATMNGTGGVVLAGNAAITGTLTLTTGNITLGANSLALSASATGSTASHIITNGTGNVIIMALAATNSRIVPVGSNATSYNPVTITANAGHTTDNFTVSVRTGVFINGVSGAQFTANTVDRTWVINEAAAGGSNVNLSFQWTGTQELTGFQRNRSYVIRHNGATWVAGPASPAPGGDPYTQTLSGVTTFSAFAVQSENIPRPRTGIYPNPASNQLNIVLDMLENTPATFSVYDSKGSLMIQTSSTVIAGISRTTLNLDKLASGVYVLKVSTSANPELLVERFVKQR